MAFILRKNFKVVNLLRLLGRHQNIRSRFTYVGTSRSMPNKLYATAAAQNYKANYTSDGFEDNYRTTDLSTRDHGDIDKALYDIDYAVKRTGRTILEGVHSVFQMIENVGMVTENQSLYLLRCCGLLRLELPTKRVELVNKVWKKLEALEVKLNIRHFNALLKVYLDSNENFTPSDILISMEHHNVEPNQETYCCLIEMYCRDGNLNGANEILEFLKEKNIPVNEAVFNSLIKGHMKIDDSEGAKDIMEVMRNSNISPSAHTYFTLAYCYADKGNLDEVERVMNEAESMGITFENIDYLQILLSAASKNNDEFVDKMLLRINDVYEWRQDIMNTAADLVHKGLDNIAFKLIMEVSSTEYSTAANNFLKMIIKADIPVEKVIPYCTEIYDSGYNNYIFANGSKISVENGKVDHAVAFFNEMRQRGISVRTRNFKPLFVANKYSVEGVWKIMKTMADLGVPLDYALYREHILPVIGKGSPQQLISKIEECGHTVSCVVDPLFEYYCSEGEIDNALYVIENHSVKVNMYFNLNNFLSLYNKFARSSTAYFKVLKYIMENAGLPGQDVNSLRGHQLADFLQINPRIFEAFHKSYIGKDCNYNGRSLEICRRKIQMNAPNLMTYLRMIRNPDKSEPIKEVTVEEENDLLNTTSSSFSQQRRLTELLVLHIKNHDIERARNIKRKLDEQDFILPPRVHAQMFFLECEMGNLEAAKNCLEKMKELYPTFKMDTSRLIDYARLLLKYSNYDEALAIIEKDCQEVNSFSDTDSLLRSVRRFLNNIVQTGNVDFAKTVQASLIKYTDFSHLKEVILEPVVKIYLYKGDLENALKEYENCIVNYHCSPCENMFMKKLILADDDVKLQAVVDLASKIERNSKVLHKLGLAFLDLDRHQQAVKVFQNLGRDINYAYLEEIGKEFVSSNKITALENLLHATANLNHENREKLYSLLLSNYCKKNQFEKCSEMLDCMRKENIVPSNEYKQLINELCMHNKKPLYFPDAPEINKSGANLETNSNETLPFLNFVLQGDGEQALKELKTMRKGYIRTIPFQDMSNFIELITKDNQLNNLAGNIQAMSYIIDNSSEIFKPLLEKYSNDGNVEAMISLASIFPDFSLKKGFFNSFLARAYLKSNRPEDLLSELEARAEKKNKLFSIAAFQELLKLPHLEDKVVKLAKNYLKTSNFDLPLTVAWAHYFTSEQYDKAHELSQITHIPVDKVDTFIFKHIQDTENIELGKRYLEFVSSRNFKDRTKERAYGILLDLLVLKQMHDEAVHIVMDAKSKNVDLEKHYQSTLTTLKSSLERENKPVPFSLSVQNDS